MSCRTDICWTTDDSPSNMASNYSNQRAKKKQPKNQSKDHHDKIKTSSRKSTLSKIKKTLDSSDKTIAPAAPPSHPTLVDLSQEDKERIAKLIKELARIGEEKENVVSTLNDERQKFVSHIQRLENEKQELVSKQNLLSAEVKQFQHLLKHYETLVTLKDTTGSINKDEEEGKGKVNKSSSVQGNGGFLDQSDNEGSEGSFEAESDKMEDIREQRHVLLNSGSQSKKLRKSMKNYGDVEVASNIEENGNSDGHPITVKELSDDDTVHNFSKASQGNGIYMHRSKLDPNQYRTFLEEQKLKLLAEQKVLARLLHEQEQNLVIEWEKRKNNETTSHTAPPTPYAKKSPYIQGIRNGNEIFTSTINKSMPRQSSKGVDSNSLMRSQSPLVRHSLSFQYLTNQEEDLDMDDGNQLRRTAQSNSFISSVKACESNLESSYCSAIPDTGSNLADDTEILNEIFFVV